jgi:hypothetical protein
MTWGAINEWCTHAGYARLIERERHPVLTELLERIMRQETRHVAFYTRHLLAYLLAGREHRRPCRPAARAQGSRPDPACHRRPDGRGGFADPARRGRGCGMIGASAGVGGPGRAMVRHQSTTAAAAN